MRKGGRKEARSRLLLRPTYMCARRSFGGEATAGRAAGQAAQGDQAQAGAKHLLHHHLARWWPVPPPPRQRSEASERGREGGRETCRDRPRAGAAGSSSRRGMSSSRSATSSCLWGTRPITRKVRTHAEAPSASPTSSIGEGGEQRIEKKKN